MSRKKKRMLNMVFDWYFVFILVLCRYDGCDLLLNPLQCEKASGGGVSCFMFDVS